MLFKLVAAIYYFIRSTIPKCFGQDHVIKIIILMSFTLSSFPSMASLFSIDEAQIFKVASEAAYQSSPDLMPDDLDRASDLLSIRCFADQDCYAVIEYRVLPTLSRALNLDEDGNCLEELDYQSISITVYASGKTMVMKTHSSTSSPMDCELVPSN